MLITGLWSAQKKTHFSWTEFCFDYNLDSPYHGLNNLLQCQHISLHPELHSFLAKVLYWWDHIAVFQHILKILSGVCNLVFVVANPCMKMKSHAPCAPWTTHSQFEPDKSWHCYFGLCPWHQGRKISMMEISSHWVHTQVVSLLCLFLARQYFFSGLINHNIWFLLGGCFFPKRLMRRRHKQLPFGIYRLLRFTTN